MLIFRLVATVRFQQKIWGWGLSVYLAWLAPLGLHQNKKYDEFWFSCHLKVSAKNLKKFLGGVKYISGLVGTVRSPPEHKNMMIFGLVTVRFQPKISKKFGGGGDKVYFWLGWHR